MSKEITKAIRAEIAKQVKEAIPKPIFIAEVPIMDAKGYNEVLDSLREAIKGYHILVLPSPVAGSKFQAYYPKDFDNTNLDALTDMVRDKLKSIELQHNLIK